MVLHGASWHQHSAQLQQHVLCVRLMPAVMQPHYPIHVIPLHQFLIVVLLLHDQVLASTWNVNETKPSRPGLELWLEKAKDAQLVLIGLQASLYSCPVVVVLSIWCLMVAAGGLTRRAPRSFCLCTPDALNAAVTLLPSPQNPLVMHTPNPEPLVLMFAGG